MLPQVTSCETHDVARRLGERGVVVVDAFLDGAGVRYLRALGAAKREAGAMHAARVGRGRQTAVQQDIRSDAIAWIDPDPSQPVEAQLLQRLEQLRLAINAHCLLGLLDIEMHLAMYPPGGFYRAHVDRFRDDDARAVSMVIWLNDHWEPAHGGELRLWPEGPDAPHEDVEPRAGRLILFLAADTRHEVLVTNVERWSLTGWFRRRGAIV